MFFEITSPSIIHCGAGVFSRTPDEAARLGRRAAVVAGRHFLDSPDARVLTERLSGLGVTVFAAEPVAGEPDVDLVDELAGFLRSVSADVVVAVGGGSVIDAAKAAAAVAVNEGRTEDYQLKRRELTVPPLPVVAAPTTAGTGSEATRVSVLNNPAEGVKRSISHPLMTPAAAILDPVLTTTLDRRMTVLTAMDALAHAIESAVCRNANPYTRSIAVAAVEQVSTHLPACLRDPRDCDARLGCLIGSCFAGLAMQAGLGASHSLAPAVCVVAGIRHSEAIAGLLPHAIRLNSRHIPGLYAPVNRAMQTEDAADRIEQLCAEGGIAPGLAQYGLKPSDWPDVLEAINRYASHRQTNPVEVTDEFAMQIYMAAVAQAA